MVSMKIFDFTNGLDSWILQRASAIFLLLYMWPLLIFWLIVPEFYAGATWQDFLLCSQMRVLGVLAMFGLLLHACIGVWVVVTDYIHIDIYRQAVLIIFYLITILSSLMIALMLSFY